jgi:hypothetical protein
LLLAAVPGAAPAAAVLDVPFLAQGEDLCGGAAVAMVMRYWGAADVQAEDFAPLVEPARAGITTGALVRAVDERGWRALPFRASVETVRGHLARGRPVVALIRVAGGRHHYVVLVAWSGGRVLLHDPALGPFRVWTERDLLTAWQPTETWALLVLPEAPARAAVPRPAPDAAPPPAAACTPLVSAAVEAARQGDWDEAGSRLEAAVALCPGDARPVRELAGVRFQQQRWKEAASYAERAAAADPRDDFTWRLLGTSRFLAGDPDGALVAWNRVGEPGLDRVHVDGLERTRAEVLKAVLDLPPRAVLTRDAVIRARRRLGELPAVSSWRLGVEPLGGGRADLRAAVVERPVLEPVRAWLGRSVVDAVTGREVRVVAASLIGGGEALGGGVRWWSGRPGFWITASEPGAFGLPGITTVAALLDDQRYATPEAGVRERRRRVALSAADWTSASLRLGLTVAFDQFERRTRSAYASLAVSAERRAAGERMAIFGEGACWRGAAPPFATVGLRAAFRSAVEPRRLVAHATAGIEAASGQAPFAVWQGAGTGTGRPFLLRGHPLMRDRSIAGDAFGRTLIHGTVELEAKGRRLGPLAIGGAAFVDVARARSRLTGPGWGRGLADAGLGLRLRAPGMGPAVRIDAATPIGSSRWRVSAAWVGRWPGRL